MRRKILRLLFVRIPFWTILASLALVTLLKWVPVRYTPLMLKRAFQFRSVENYHSEQEWVSLEDFSPELIKAVVASEDNRFFEHRGFDWIEVDNMRREHREEGNALRGCSTISQQTAKNVFTFGSRTWIRKANEAYWTALIELIWGKRRILEVYLNVAETGPGLYGMEAASRHYFGTGSADLGRKQAVALSVCLPSPLKTSPGDTDAFTRRRQKQVYALIRKLNYPTWVG